MDHGFYKLDEGAKLLGCEINDLLKWGAAGKIELCIWYTGEFINRLFDYDAEAQGIVLPWNTWDKRKQILILHKDDIMHLFVNGWTDVISLTWPGYGLITLLEARKGLTVDMVLVTSETLSALKADRHKSHEILTAPKGKILKNEINVVWQGKLEARAAELAKQGKTMKATKGGLARELSKEIKVEAATIERQTRKTW